MSNPTINNMSSSGDTNLTNLHIDNVSTSLLNAQLDALNVLLDTLEEGDARDALEGVTSMLSHALAEVEQ